MTARPPVRSDLSAAEQAALDFARQEFHWYRDNASPWSASSGLSAPASAMVQSFLSFGWADVRARMRLVLLARLGLSDAQAVLHRMILEHQTRREPMPTELEAYDMEVKTFGLPAPWAGPKKASRMLRDMIITITTLAVSDKFGLPRTRRSSKRRSACEIASMALGSVGISIGHKGVEKIVDRYRCALSPSTPGWSAQFWPGPTKCGAPRISRTTS